MSGKAGRRLQLAAGCAALAAYAGLCHLVNSRLAADGSGALARPFAWFNFLQDALLDVVLGTTFLGSLAGNRIPLCTRLADRLHGPLSREERIYTRRVTLAWAVFFGALLTVSTGLFVVASRAAWSLFANLCTLPLMLLMFVAENAVRRRVLPKKQRPGILATLQVYLTSPR